MNMLRGKYPPFLGSETGNGPAESSMFHVIPVPLERSVSYGAGAKNGPSAILAASQQLEVYDGRSVPAEKGIHTKAPVRCGGSILEILARITESVADSIRSRAIPVVLGGERSGRSGNERGATPAEDACRLCRTKHPHTGKLAEWRADGNGSSRGA